MFHIHRNHFFRLANLLLVLILGWGFVRFLLPVLLPFLLAFCLAWAIEPVVILLMGRLRLSRPWAVLLVSLLSLTLIGGGLFFLGRRVLYELQLLLGSLPALLTKLPDFSGGLTQWAYPYIIATPIPIQATLWEGLSQCSTLGIQLVSSLSAGLFDGLLALISALPLWGLFLFTTALATYFTSAARPALLTALHRYTPQTWRDTLSPLFSRFPTLFLGWLRAQGTLIAISFLQLTLGFFLLGVDYPLLLAGGIALVDALPVLGTGTVLLPWAVFCVIQGQISRGVALLILYGLISLVRGLLEPKLVGSQVGLPPLVTLFSMYLGFQFLGILGMIIAPLVAVFCRALLPEFPRN